MTPDEDASPGDYSSPPCLASEIDPSHFDPQKVSDVVRWRKAERVRLLAERMDLEIATRKAAADAIAKHLDAILSERFTSIKGLTISAWWPIKAELDLRFWLAGLAGRGAQAALPVVVQRSAPLVFRAWTAESRMERGFWNIPVPASEPEVVPDITLSPLVGWDEAGFRLGYGGGYFDRTLAAISPAPLAIGVGLQAAKVATIFPQSHDIPMAVIVTEAGVHGE